MSLPELELELELKPELAQSKQTARDKDKQQRLRVTFSVCGEMGWVGLGGTTLIYICIDTSSKFFCLPSLPSPPAPALSISKAICIVLVHSTSVLPGSQICPCHCFTSPKGRPQLQEGGGSWAEVGGGRWQSKR